MIIVVTRYIYMIIAGMVMSMMAKQAPARPSPLAVKGKDSVKLNVGDKVRLKKRTFQLYVAREKDMHGGLEITEARIEYFFSGVKGLAKLEYKLGGYWSWDVNDLEKVQW
jgi:hypothetical protein